MDYTKLPDGAKVGRKFVKTCPQCGETGLYTKSNNREFYVHRDLIGLNDENELEHGAIEHMVTIESTE